MRLDARSRRTDILGIGFMIFPLAVKLMTTPAQTSAGASPLMMTSLFLLLT